MTVLEVTDLHAKHGLLHAVRGISLALAEGETLALVGANGSGKTTLLRTIAGAHPAEKGRVRLDGVDITSVPAHHRVRRGLALVPEGRRLFPELTVLENLQVAGRRGRRGEWTIDTVLDAFPVLRPITRKQASQISGGQQQAAAIARALMTNPRVLLIDEVSLGLAPVAVDAVYESLTRLLGSGATVVLVEQDLERALSVSQRVMCVLEGHVALAAATPDITRDQVTAAYFGVRSATAPAPTAGTATSLHAEIGTP
ncbi:High-affinity branched-chain amino acid transport ATP-binding protein LivF [Frankia sp. AiPs1]|uniref:ABC transporter ATP-binding protein n=1 Tax=Frankia sp. AiPa1 TaxID=573492 RepID=UPI00202AD994|nr:ATP-binding cassette domain-containing protein [Frankia sp. AiPa1]MCL9763007.1 ATP-binding cassette domain-containing protein [Frankia sp. AiPa1]